MAHRGSLSDFWRQDASDDRVAELTSVLRGSDSLIGVMGSGVRAVWSTNGESQTWWVRTKEGKPAEMRVFLDYSPLRPQDAPFLGQAVDEVIGYAAHEGGHCLWSSADARDEVINILQNRPNEKSKRAARTPVLVEEVLRVANIVEDAFIDYHVGEEWAVLGEYIHISRQKIAERRPIDLDAIARDARPNFNQMCNLWIACSLYDYDLPKRMSARVRRAMTFLMNKSVEAVQSSSTSLRLALAVHCWEHLIANFPHRDDPLPSLPMPSPMMPQAGGQPQAGEGEGVKAGGKPSAGQGETEGKDTGVDNVPGEGKADTEEDNVPGEGEEGEQGEEAEGEEAGGADGEHIDEGGEPEPEPEPAEQEQEHGHFSGEAGEESEEGEQEETSEQGGDELGAPGNLDEFDIRDLEEIPEEVLEEILDAIVHEMEDISRSVAEVISKPIGDVMAQTQRADYDGPAADKVRSRVEREIAEMRRIFDRQASVASRQIKGLTIGKLDGRSLARVGAGNLKVFRRREVLETPDLAVGLLLDVSGSMHSHMDYVWATGAVFSEGLVRKRGVNFLALTYTGGYFDVQTTRICDREMGQLCLGNVTQGGGTPSGPAIGSLKVLMDRMPERQKVIIHFTDGAPDDAHSVLTAVEACRKAGYRVWAISLQGYERMLDQQYGQGNWETISAIRELPEKVANLVKQLVAPR